MRLLLTRSLRAVLPLIACVFLPASLQAATRTVSIPNYHANPGEILEVPVLLSNAEGLAAIRAQINFDPGVLELLSVSPGPLGQAFELSYRSGEGFVQLVFVRSEGISGGTGQLALLRFRVNAGAPQGSYSELALADIRFSDSTGVVDLRQKDALSLASGTLNVSFGSNIDNERNGLPDWWEKQHGLDLFSPNDKEDPDGDGLANFAEYALGANPLSADVAQRTEVLGFVDVSSDRFLTLDFCRRKDDPSISIVLEESSDCVHWHALNLSQQLLGAPQDRGDGTEFVRTRGTIPMGGAQKSSFLRLRVERP